MSRSGPGSAPRFWKNGGSARRCLPVPRVPARLRAPAAPSSVVALEHRRVAPLEERGLERGRHGVAHFGGVGQMSCEIHRLAVLAGAERLPAQVDVHPSRQREGHDQHRRRQVVGPHLRMDAGLEIPVAAQHRGRHQSCSSISCGHRLGQRPAVADARRAAVAHGMESQLFEIGQQAGALEIIGDDPGPGGEAGLDPRLGLRPRSTAFLATSPAPIMTEGLEVLVQLVMAAMTTDPSWRLMSASPSLPETIGGASGSSCGRARRLHRSSRSRRPRSSTANTRSGPAPCAPPARPDS